MSDLPTEARIYADSAASGDQFRRDTILTNLRLWHEYRMKTGKVLTETLADNFARAMKRRFDMAAVSIYSDVADYHEWLVRTGINSANPFTPYRVHRRRSRTSR